MTWVLKNDNKLLDRRGLSWQTQQMSRFGGRDAWERDNHREWLQHGVGFRGQVGPAGAEPAKEFVKFEL